MIVEFLTPAGALLALAAVVPVAAFLAISSRAKRVREALGLDELPSALRLVPLVSVLVVAGLLGLAAAQPLLQRTATRQVRADAEVLLVLDISRSMLARRSLGEPTRLERAKAAASRLRASLPEVPVGIASVTNRVLPHLFPSPDQDVFEATLERVVDIEHPPPGSSFLTAVQTRLQNATSLASLASVAGRHFYSPTARRRLLVVLTDGESPGTAAPKVGRSLQRARIEPVFVHFWGAKEQVFSDGEPEVRYEPDPAARSILEGLAAASGGSVYGEGALGGVERRARQVLGAGPTVARGYRPDRIALAPYLALAAFVPLTLLLWRRDR